jgi:pyrroloquinoline quinone biosynthesis protein E
VYCSNPRERRIPTGTEIDTRSWQGALTQAESLGVMQAHFSGGEPLLRSDLTTLVAHAHQLGLYTSLITSAIGLTRERLAELAQSGLDHVQISIQGLSEADALQTAGRVGLSQKLSAMAWVRELDLPLTLNVVLHRDNIEQVPGLIALALEVGAARLELANAQYLGWALENRSHLLPTTEQIARARAVALAEQRRLRGRLELLFVLPDYHAGVARACMQGWARRYIVISPDGLVLPCHQAHSLPGLDFERVTNRALADIWRYNRGLNAFRGEAWMTEPCRSCERRGHDFGGCRCQAFALTGRIDAADPACHLAPDHGTVKAALSRPAAAGRELVRLRYRRLPRNC